LVKDAEGKTAFSIQMHPIAPMDEYLGIDKLPFKMTRKMMNETAFMGQNQPSYQMAEYMMSKREGYNVSAEYIRQVTNYVGNEVFEHKTRSAIKTEKNLVNIPYTHDKKGILYIMIDGAAINTRKKDADGSSYRENKLVLIFNGNDLRTRKDGITHDILRKEYTPFIGNVDEFRKYVLDSAVRNGYGRYRETVVLSDGAAWIRTMCDEIVPDAVQILDFYHLAENIHTFSKNSSSIVCSFMPLLYLFYLVSTIEPDVPAYYLDLAQVFQSLRKQMKDNSIMCFVIGDSAPYGIYAPADIWLSKLAMSANFKECRFEKIRDRNIKWKNRKHRVPLKEGRLWIRG
jgi:hypothetical protein